MIEDTFWREADIDARRIRIEVSGHTAKLYGRVHSLPEAPGVVTVESYLLVPVGGKGNRAGWSWRNVQTLLPASRRRRVLGAPMAPTGTQ